MAISSANGEDLHPEIIPFEAYWALNVGTSPNWESNLGSLHCGSL